jgi:hypothetical protein
MAENILHSYVNWTYNIQLFSITSAGYNDMQTSPTTTPSGMRLLMASGGIQTNRSPNFKEDFFFNNLKFHSVVAPTENTQNTNSLSFEFLLIEPMGVTLFNRLIAEAGDQGYQKVTDMIYVLKIEFFGYTDAGAVTKIPVKAKIFPIKINEMIMKISHRGSEYACKASPAPHITTLGKGLGSTPVKIEITANSIGEALLADIRVPPPPTDGQMVSYPKSHPSVNSFTGALNQWFNDQLADKQVTDTDSIVFEIHPDIANAKFVTGEEIQKSDRHMEPADGQGGKQQGTTTKVEPSKFPQVVMTIAEGTAITEVVSMLVRNSTFITDQLKDPDRGQGAPASGPMKWFKITPRMIYQDFDKTTNRLMRQHIYRVMPYTFYNATHRSYPFASNPPAKKEYNYIFTGKNKDIVSLDLTFDTAYYTSLTTNAANQEAGNSAQKSVRSEAPERAKTMGDQATNDGTQDSIDPNIGQEVVGEKSQQGDSQGANAGLSRNTKTDISRQMQSHVVSGDMLDLKLKIVGDPDWIVQDDVTFWNTKPGQDETENGSICTDNGQVFIKVHFRSAGDYDENGVAMPGSGPFSVGVFSGLYGVRAVDNEFSGGKFFQTFEAARYPLQSSVTDSGATSSGFNGASGGSSGVGGSSSGSSGGSSGAGDAAAGAASGGSNIRKEDNQVPGISQVGKALLPIASAVSPVAALSSASLDVASKAMGAVDSAFKALGPVAASAASALSSLPTKLGIDALLGGATRKVEVDVMGGIGNVVSNATQDVKDKTRVVATTVNTNTPYADVPNKVQYIPPDP